MNKHFNNNKDGNNNLIKIPIYVKKIMVMIVSYIGETEQENKEN
jgi:hypothetical protein